MPVPVPERSELEREQAYLEHARSQLARMRDKALATQASGGDRVSTEFLALTMHRRAAQLVDDPDTALFFGRLDLTESDDAAQRWYVGRRHVADEQGDPVVIDWRAQLSAAFYRASSGSPMGVDLRRRFGVDRGRLTAYEDEHLVRTEPTDVTAGRISHLVVEEIERPRVGPMRDIVATIQPEQDEIVRADASSTVCVQGAPGTGKTAVGLHRAAWLLYAYRDRLHRAGVLVVGPNRAFLDHIGAVLPALGEVEVRHTTIEDLVADEVAVTGSDSAQTATLKGDARMAAVLHRAVWAHVGPVAESLVVPRGVRKWRVPASTVAEVLEELGGRSIRYEAARQVLPQRLAHHVLLAMERSGDSPDDRVQDAVARSAAMRAYVASVWPKLDRRQVLWSLLASADQMARHAAGILSPDEQHLVQWAKPPRSARSARWSPADAVLLDEIGDLLDRTPSLGHVVLDEAQDLSAMQLRAVGRRCSTGSATVLGDIAQGTTPWATESWAWSLQHLGKPDSHVEVLDRGFRVPAAVIDFAARLLPAMAPGLGAPRSVRDNPGRLELLQVPAAQLAERVAAAVVASIAEPGSVGVITPASLVAAVSDALTEAGVDYGVLGAERVQSSDPDTARRPVDHQVEVVPARVAKGLEFDRVVVVEPSAIAADEPDERTGLRRLYVVLTRAVSELTVVHSQDLPLALR